VLWNIAIEKVKQLSKPSKRYMMQKPIFLEVIKDKLYLKTYMHGSLKLSPYSNNDDYVKDYKHHDALEKRSAINSDPIKKTYHKVCKEFILEYKSPMDVKDKKSLYEFLKGVSSGKNGY
jgi:hypothetical protein